MRTSSSTAARQVPSANELEASAGAKPSDAHYQALAQSMQQRAWAEVGLGAAEVARMQQQHAALRANDAGKSVQHADEVLELAARRRLMQRIAAAYGRRYLRDADSFLWMGFAAVAVNDGVAPTAELAMCGSRLLRAVSALGGRGAELGALGLGVALALTEDGIKAAFRANFAIFADLYWVHLAYGEGGLLWLRGMYRCGALSRELLDAFTLIEEGRQAAEREAGMRLIAAGNRLLFLREQSASVTPVFETYGRAMRFATLLGLIALPNRELRTSCLRLGLSPSWPRSRDPESTSYGPFARRWQWLDGCGWSAFLALYRERPTTLAREVERAIAARPEGVLGRLRQLAAC